MDLVSAITSDDFPSVLREQPELVNARDQHGVSALLLVDLSPASRGARRAAGGRRRGRPARGGRARRRREAADPDARGGDGFTPLHLAAFFGGAEAVRALLAMGVDADADADNTFRVHPIHSASAVGDHDSVRALLEAGANPNVRQQGGFTPLHTAAHNDDATLAPLLLDHGADPNLAADDGKTPRDMAPGGPVQPVKCTLPFERARAWARSMKSSRLIAARNSRATSFMRAVSERRSSSPCSASSPNSTVAAIS